MFVFGLQAYISDKFIQNKVELKSPKKEPLGNIGKNLLLNKLNNLIVCHFLKKLSHLNI